MAKPDHSGGAIPVMDAEAFANEIGVSRETRERLKAYAALLEKWQRRINLVGAGTLPDLWRRHMLDSAQLTRLAPAAQELAARNREYRGELVAQGARHNG